MFLSTYYSNRSFILCYIIYLLLDVYREPDYIWKQGVGKGRVRVNLCTSVQGLGASYVIIDKKGLIGPVLWTKIPRMTAFALKSVRCRCSARLVLWTRMRIMRARRPEYVHNPGNRAFVLVIIDK